MKANKRILLILTVCVLLLSLLSGCAAKEKKTYQTIDDLSHAKIGIITGSAHDKTAKQFLPNAQRVYFNSMIDMIIAVEQGKIDCYMEDAPFLAPLIWEGAGVTPIKESVATVQTAFVFPKSEKSDPLLEEVNAFLAQAKKDGTIERLMEKWTGETEPTEHPDYSSLTGENGTIHLAISVDNKPLLYQYKNQYTGFEMELLTLFARQNGYKFEIEVLPFESIIAGITTGKYDMAASSLNITPERAESVKFSDPHSEYGVVLVVKKAAETNGQRIHSLSELENGTLAMLTGSIYDDIAQNLFPNAQRKYYSNHSDMIISLRQGKIDAIFEDNTIYTTMCWENKPVTALEETIATNQSALILAKNGYDQELLNQLNAFIVKSEQDGTFERLMEKWFSDSEPTEHFDHSKLKGENGVLKIAVADTMKPMSYRSGNTYTGYELDLLGLFAEEYGYRLEIEGMSFDALIPAVSSGKCDIGAAGITITEERSHSVTFSAPHMTTYGYAIVYSSETERASGSFWENVKESFEKTFIREDRWKLILEGIGVTMLISVCSGVAGSALGFGLYMLSRADVKPVRKVAKSIGKIYSRIIEGMPVVVILMILFYVVFGSLRNMSGILVAIIGFSLTFGSFVYDHLTLSVQSVDHGQTEAAYSLGYTKNKTFFRIIFPQAMTIFMPTYIGQAVELIKATAVVGYIAVNDLTKMGDIIRSNTYEAFFPLITTAVIYFLLTWLVSVLLGYVKKRLEPKRRRKEKILKGVMEQ